ncbi:C39 family peptidase [Micromonospora sp. RTGN7]|uniref:C39 family peptidase n=1 Tax=Micromonospora sp. RTGN7 TaxID=3016526 RepID=UPI0029FED69F|nr:C39 family peptidase [Micromonospora sp. RTGN7]
MTGSTSALRRDVAFRRFRLPADLPTGTCDAVNPDSADACDAVGPRATGASGGVGPGADGAVLAAPTGRLGHPDDPTRRYDVASWTSPPVSTGFAVAEVVPSWTADTPDGCGLWIEARGWHADAPATGWYTLARWATDDEPFGHTSVPGQQDADARVDADTLVVTGATVTGWQVRVTLLRPAGSAATPVLRQIGAVASGPQPDGPVGAQPDAPVGTQPGTSVGAYRAAEGDRAGWGRVLDVPRYSQRLHGGDERRWGGGGDSWCSPTSVSMVLDYWGAGPTADRYAWVVPAGSRPAVVHAARHCYDPAYGGAGNWAFNTAYAGRHGVDAFVTRLRSLAEAGAFVAAGVPLVLSATFRRGEVPGLDYDTQGHLMVLVGFTVDGDPVLNDPYAPDDVGVRRTVDRHRFEAAWQGGSGGIVYVIHPPDVALPPPPAQPNW